MTDSTNNSANPEGTDSSPEKVNDGIPVAPAPPNSSSTDGRWTPASSSNDWDAPTKDDAAKAAEGLSGHYTPHTPYGQQSPYGSPADGSSGYAQSGYVAPPAPASGSSPYGAPQYGHNPQFAPQYGNQFGGGTGFGPQGPVDQAAQDEEVSKWVGIGGLVAWGIGWFLGGFTFIFTVIAGIVGLVYAYRARRGGRRATAGLVMGWINSIGIVLTIFIVVLLFLLVFAAAGAGGFG